MIAKMAAGTEMGRLLVWRAGLAQEPGPAQHPRDEPRQVARHRARGPVRARRDPGPRRQRLLERVPGRALPAQLEGRGHLRGHEPAPHAHPGRLRPRLSRGPAAALRAVAGPGLGAPGLTGPDQVVGAAAEVVAPSAGPGGAAATRAARGAAIRPRAVTIRATATTMTAPATTVRASIDLAEDDGAEDDRDDRVDVGVRRDQRQRRDAQHASRRP